MKLPDAVQGNLSFLLAEIDGQLARLEAYFAASAPASAPDAAQSIALGLAQRSGYAQNLSARVARACLTGRGGKPARALRLESVEKIARNLDLLSRLARRAAMHAERVRRRKLLRAADYAAPLAETRAAVGRVRGALERADSRAAVDIGRAREALGAFHDRMFDAYTGDMGDARHAADLAHALLALNEVQRMGEALQAVGEALLSITIGQAVRFDRYFTLQGVLDDIGGEEEVDLRPLAETRSGSAISAVRMTGADGAPVSAVFKDGDRRKVKEERVGVKSWNSVYPGLAPKILSYRKRGDQAALLIEHLEGRTFEDIVLGGTDAQLAAAQDALHRTVRDIWRRTRIDQPAEMKAMDQLARRMDDVHRLHPGFARGPQRIGEARAEGFDALIAAAARREKALPAPFSVWIHGDFNLDNVIHDPATGKIRFIDLHRSRYMDYVQDVSVFMVSNHRLQAPDRRARARIAAVALAMHDTAAKFARRQKDAAFSYRLALGLARSFASSTRFVADRDHARRMMLRARYLLETALAVPEGKEARFRPPIGELFRE